MRLAGALAAAAIFALAAPAAGSAAGRCGDHPWCDTSLNADQRADLLVKALTPAERTSLLGGDELSGVAGGEGTHTGTSNGVPRVGLPPMYLSDGPAGTRQGKATAFAAPIGMAAAFDPAIARKAGALVGDEVRRKGNDVVYAPTVDIMRTPLGGRTFEAYGEDPFLSSALGVAWAKGAASQGVIVNVKHFAGNNQEGYAGPAANNNAPGQPLGVTPVEGNRFTADSRIDERTLREIYLKPYEAVLSKAGVGSIMCSYQKLNGTYACENRRLLEEILRKEWGFKGFVIADYGAAHMTADNLNGGLDFEPWPGQTLGPTMIQGVLLGGQVTQATIDEHARRILRTLFAYGFFDRAAYPDDTSSIDQQGHAREAQKIAEAGITLLRNQGNVLPLDPKKLKSIALIGADAALAKGGGGSSKISPFFTRLPTESIPQRAGSGVKVTYDDGSDPERAAALAGASDVAVVIAGDYLTEGSDRYCLTLECPTLHGDQDALIEKVAGANKKTVVVLQTGGPVLTPWREKVAGLLEAWYPGQMGGPALASVLFGDVDPGGRLPATFPRSEADLPTAGDPRKYPGVAERVDYLEGVLVGYRWYDAKKKDPAFPFGFGLSYTSFRYDKLRAKPSKDGKGARITFDVTNTGKRKGIAVPQLYVAIPAPAAGEVQAPRQLKGMARLELKPGKRKRVVLKLTERDLSSWNVKANGWKVVPGCYPIAIGRSSRSTVTKGKLAVAGGRC
jgi:beta-glucosidase